jgi:hypothetical protein
VIFESAKTFVQNDSGDQGLTGTKKFDLGAGIHLSRWM